MISALIIDDEPKSCEVLSKMLSAYCKDITLLGTAHSADEGIGMIRRMQPELIFLDVEMPEGNGFYLLDQVHDMDLKVVFVTAYDHYAIKAIKFSAMDYLLKPLGIEQLKDTVAKFTKQKNFWEKEKQQILKENTRNRSNAFSRIAIATYEGFEFIETTDIIWLQASNTYTIFHLNGKRSVVSTMNLKHYEDLLEDQGLFVRIHHSHSINMNHAVRFLKTKNASVVMSDGKELEVSIRKKDTLLEMIYNNR